VQCMRRVRGTRRSDASKRKLHCDAAGCSIGWRTATSNDRVWLGLCAATHAAMRSHTCAVGDRLNSLHDKRCERVAACVAAHKPKETLALPSLDLGSTRTGPQHTWWWHAAPQRPVSRRARLLQVADDRADAPARRRGRVHDGRFMRRRRHRLHRVAVHHGQYLASSRSGPLEGARMCSLQRPARLALSWRP